ncbi:Rta1p [Saccharomyces eubayanus]|uniref:Rta1p n=1 Tax=Saccharomyces eubayanus TaxID=1080349 RepID=UPI0006C5E4F9|nr:RTA1-like protein [Saccharomyces eubayanus]KOG99699.1 RTA1-like protein [Saccharomyces eubayanus]
MSKDDFELYRYTPNLGAAILFTILFALAGALFTYLLVHYSVKSKRATASEMRSQPTLRCYGMVKLAGAYVPFVVGCGIEFAGFALRCRSSKHTMELNPYIIQTVFLLVSPTLYAATFYMIFGRMATLLFAENLMIMPAKFNTTIFVIGDVGSLLLQAAGGAMMSSASTASSGSHIVTAGLFIQIAFFGLFIINEFLFIYKISKKPTSISVRCNTWKSLNITLLVNSFLILIRSIVRAVEFIEGYDGVIASHEWFLYVFDALPMFLLVIAFAAVFPWTNIFRIQEESIQAQQSTKFDSEAYPNVDGVSIEDGYTSKE